MIFYFDMKTLELEWAEMIKPINIVVQIDEGLNEREFTDEDFRDVVTECPRRSKKIHMSSFEKIHEAFGLI